MSFAGVYNESTKSMDSLKLDEIKIGKQLGIKNAQSAYHPDEIEKKVLLMIKRHFMLGYANMYVPRVEFSDLSLIQRAMVDQMSFNTYQPNNGESYEMDEINSWRSNAMRPIVRNKVISIAAHATAHLLFPKVFAWNKMSDIQKDAAQVMLDLMEWSGEQSDYAKTTLYNTLSALVNPMAVTYTEFADVKRRVKREKKEGGGYREEEIQDEVLSGFKDTPVSPDEIFFPNFYESDVQKQDWLIWRRAISFDMAEARFGTHPNFKHIHPGIQVFYNDANQSFYQVYDQNMRGYDCEWIRYWNRSLDLMIDIVNGVMVSDCDRANPRQDKLFPFTWIGYEVINSRFACFKSLAFKLMHDANIINTLYPMIIDGTYLNLFPAMIISGEENVGSTVIVPGKATALANPDATVHPIQLGTNLKAGFEALTGVEESLNQSSENPSAMGSQSAEQTAYQISVQEQEKNTVLGLFVQMIGSFVKQYGRLRMGDIIQYMTIGEVQKIEGDQKEDPAMEGAEEDMPLTYRTFFLHDKTGGGKHKKIKFDSSLPDKLPSEGYDDTVKEMSYQNLRESGAKLSEDGVKEDATLAKVNPELFRDLTYMLVVSPDVMNPLSENVERAYNLELYDRMIKNPMANQESNLELLLESTPTTRKDPHKFIQKQPPMGQPGMPGQPMPWQGAGQPNPMAMNNAPQPVKLPSQQPVSAGQKM